MKPCPDAAKRALVAALAAAALRAQTAPPLPSQAVHWYSRYTSPYTAPWVPPVSFQNSPRLESLIRAGNLYLSLSDAIALALENNLDVSLQRYGPAIAASDIRRTEGGGEPRGISVNFAETPAGIGGPSSPLVLTAPTGTIPVSSLPSTVSELAAVAAGQGSVSILPAGGFSLGPPIPAFDPVLPAQFLYQHSTTPQTVTFLTGTQSLITRDWTWSTGWQQGFSPGTQISTTFNSLNTRSNSLRTTFNPYTTANLTLNVVQPLLRGFGMGLNRRFIRVAKNNSKISDLVFQEQVIATVEGVIRLYFDLVSLKENLAVKRDTVNLAQTLLANNRKELQVGTAAPIDVVQVQAQVAAAQQDLANAEGFASAQELVLKSVLTRRGNADAAVREAQLVPTTPIDMPVVDVVRPVEDLVAEALANRPDIGEADLQLANSNLYLEGSRNELLPDLNLVATAQSTSLAGQLNPAVVNNPNSFFTFTPPPPSFIGGFPGALAQLIRGRFPSYSLGLQLNLPLRNRVAQADVARDELQLRQTEIRNQQLRNQIRLEVESAVIAVHRSRAAYEAASQARQLQEQLLAAENKRFSAGVATTVLVIQAENNLAQARSTEVAARNVYIKARTELERALGRTLGDHHISIDQAYRGRITTPPAP